MGRARKNTHQYLNYIDINLDQLSKGDIDMSVNSIDKNILRKKNSLHQSILNFSFQNTNTGIFAEEIIRYVFDGVNLNNMHRNHPHVDIAVPEQSAIENVTIANEIISVKSSIDKHTLAGAISNTKSITIESLFSYIVFSTYNYSYKKEFLSANKLYILAIGIIKSSKKDIDSAIKKLVGIGESKLIDDLKKIEGYANNTKGGDTIKLERNFKYVINLVLYYLFFESHRGDNYFVNFIEDILILREGHDDVEKNEKINRYTDRVNQEIGKLTNKISIAAVYFIDKDKKKFCVEKTDPIEINQYWQSVLGIWEENKFFDSNSKKYLTLDRVKAVFKEFKTKIIISVGDQEGSDILAKQSTPNMATNRMWISHKLKDAEFSNREDDINKFFSKSIDKLEENPQLIDTFSNFLSTLEKREFSNYLLIENSQNLDNVISIKVNCTNTQNINPYRLPDLKWINSEFWIKECLESLPVSDRDIIKQGDILCIGVDNFNWSVVEVNSIDPLVIKMGGKEHIEIAQKKFGNRDRIFANPDIEFTFNNKHNYLKLFSKKYPNLYKKLDSRDDAIEIGGNMVDFVGDLVKYTQWDKSTETGTEKPICRIEDLAK
jgi:hypothetical protein